MDINMDIDMDIDMKMKIDMYIFMYKYILCLYKSIFYIYIKIKKILQIKYFYL